VYEDQAGYVFLFFLIGGHIVAYLFWYFCARDYYGGTAPVERPEVPRSAEPVAADAVPRSD
jgi:hypothetical protein